MLGSRLLQGTTHADCAAAEFRGPGTHHRFDDSPDDYDMDMDQRTRFIGGRAGRIILLGDGTEILTDQGHDDDGDVDMEDRGEAEEEEDKDLEEQVPKRDEAAKENGETDRSQREETPAPDSQDKEGESSEQVTENATPEDPKTMAPTDGGDPKAAAAQMEKK